MLNTEKNTRAMGRRIRAAARAKFHARGNLLRTVFEHGQWWVTNWKTGAQYSVNDAEGPGTVDGFDFEQVTLGEEV